MNKILNRLGKTFRRSQIPSEYFTTVEAILELESKFSSFTESEIKERINILRAKYKQNINDNGLVIESFALTRYATWVKLGLKHFETQLLGGLILKDGKIAEMKTGEGKTLVATLPASFHALSQKGLQIVTVNEYLAKRDKETLQSVYNFMGFNVGLIQQTMNNSARQINYAADLTYITNSELGFDYLRDNMVIDPRKKVLRPFYYALIDEVDSVLIDEARTPLVIGNPVPLNSKRFNKAKILSRSMVRNRHFEIDFKKRRATITEEGYRFLELSLGTTDLYNQQNSWVLYIQNALRADFLYNLDRDYIIQDGQVQIIDEFTGRIAIGRKWSDGLHQAIECKHELEISQQTITQNSITYPNFFSLFPILSGMTGTAKTSEKEFLDFYNLQVIVIPTKNPIQRNDLEDLVFQTKRSKFQAILTQTIDMYKALRPVLVGTSTIEDSEIIKQLFVYSNIPCKILNAKPENVDLESAIVAQSGKLGAITIATNMAGRGTDILLGGNLKYEINSYLRSLLRYILFSREFKDTFGLVNYFYKILFDLKFIKIELSQLPLTDCIEFIERLVDVEQLPSESELGRRINKIYLFLDNLFREKWQFERETVINLGGLLILGSERHESQRVDNQLRGRAGRQGDPGQSCFFISLEDELFSRYGGAVFDKLLTTLPPDNGEIIGGQSGKWLADSISKVQKRVENFFYEGRKMNFVYDKIFHRYRLAYFFLRNRLLLAKNYRTVFVNLLVSPSFEVFPIRSVEFFSSFDLNNSKQENAITLLYQATISYDINSLEGQLFFANEFELGVKQIIMTKLDQLWVKYSQAMELTRETIGWQAYAQKDPVQQYEYYCGLGFKEFLNSIKTVILATLGKGETEIFDNISSEEVIELDSTNKITKK
uniref:Protein translocase subunit SecA n=1 Tax=Eustigmatophyceae sp. Ndem 8/9T-3m6.8 TaxID=2506146 RepID=A0A3R5QM59_9STRA|nr:preprotein-translocase subunit a [Eustigmatophyceae sp. Ndem 8/9T-3m6.8]QAA11843.1 preprotein-translocase subunit a [Eustigmatophyceae sp. Ndem 8/9T-3m6.8]